MPSQLERPASPISAQILPNIVRSTSLVLNESENQVITALTPPPTPMPIFQNAQAAEQLMPYQICANINFPAESNAPVTVTNLLKQPTVLQIIDGRNQFSSTFANAADHKESLNELAHCNYACKYCHYRGACRSYVEAHQVT